MCDCFNPSSRCFCGINGVIYTTYSSAMREEILSCIAGGKLGLSGVNSHVNYRRNSEKKS